MSKRVAVVITEDPTKTHRPVEALRIALGLCAGDHEVTVILLEMAPLLLTEETDHIIDIDILEKYRPSFAQLMVPFVVDDATHIDGILDEFSVSRMAPADIRSVVQSSERTLVFS